MGPDARRANIRSVLITDVHISGANCTPVILAATYVPLSMFKLLVCALMGFV